MRTIELLPDNVFYDMILDDEQVAFVKAIKDLRKSIVFCDAAAGTGKTTLAMGAANILVQDKRNELEGIVYIVSPYGEQKQGYLPGSITKKSEVYYFPIGECTYNQGGKNYELHTVCRKGHAVSAHGR